MHKNSFYVRNSWGQLYFSTTGGVWRVDVNWISVTLYCVYCFLWSFTVSVINVDQGMLFLLLFPAWDNWRHLLLMCSRFLFFPWETCRLSFVCCSLCPLFCCCLSFVFLQHCDVKWDIMVVQLTLVSFTSGFGIVGRLYCHCMYCLCCMLCFMSLEHMFGMLCCLLGWMACFYVNRL